MPPYVWVNTGNVTAVPTREEGVTRGEDAYGWYRKGPISPDFEIDNVLPHLFQKGIEYIKDRAPAAKNGKPFFLYLPLPAPHTPIVPVPPFKDASGMNPYADFVMQVDHHMGELFAALKDAGIDDNTIVFFTSDNGCSNQANFDVLKKHEHDPSGGYRGHKADIFEGGHRVPFIARWPISIKAGQKTNALACLTDLYATLQDVTGQPVQDVGGEDSFSLRPAFDGDAMTNRKTLISHSIGGSFSIRQGDWKLCLCAGSGGWSAPKEPEAKKQNLPLMQLYNLKEDRGERNNLVNKHPERVQALLKLLNEEVSQGRCTPGKGLSNDRDVKFLPAGVELPVSDEQPVAADSFIGHWALTIPKGRAGWLGVTEVNGKLDASILWGGGSVVPVASTKIENGQLVVTREQIQKGGVNKGKKIVETITATRDGENLNLVTVKTRPDGKEFAKAEFTGKLTHPMPSPDLSKVKFGAPVTLFNGKDLSGWKALSPNAGMGWGVEDGVLINRTHQEGKPHRPHTNIRTEQEFEDFNLTVEARTLKDSNSGIYLRGIYEIQIFESYGKPVDSHNMGALYSRVCPSVAAEKPVGEWQSLDITLVDKHVTVILNGQTIIDNQPALGCTGGALWSDPDRSGPIYLQGNHSDIDFRNMVLRPVLKQ